ncbi:PP2C family protein-serine/threonine phosphatase [Aquiflexum lacus]|uniref:PP2C family protein-serine/threonine phosphatase n=1 Tax=Aquiflexum lacus TaxID=2483805 RepID=UPI001893B74E|nr:protein phosphatase 2C domain-containing protein [Aquiflexum lacus]
MMTEQYSTNLGFQIESFSEIGKKPNNEDSILVCKLESGIHLYMVCDGLGGHPAGEVASQITCETIRDYFSQSKLEEIKIVDILQSLEAAKEAIKVKESAYPETLGMKTTLAGIFADKFGLKIVWLGDSIAFHIRDGKIMFQTVDHSYGNYLMYQKGFSQQDVALHPKRHKITRVVAAEKEIKPEIIDVEEIKEGDFFLICSDGLLEQVNKTVIEDRFTKTTEIKELCINIYNTCKNKTKDNFSMILLKVIRNR